MGYCVYMLRCENGSIYTGITTDPARRLRQHLGLLAGGARSTRMLHPVRCEAVWAAPDRAAALSLEARIKRLTHAQKEQLIAGDTPAALDLAGYERTAPPQTE